MLKPEDLLSVVREDLDYLMTDFDDRIDDAALRRASPVLRRLLVDGELQRAWKAAGFEKQPSVEATDLDAFLGVLPKKPIEFASAGRATHGGRKVDPSVLVHWVMSPQDAMNLLRVPVRTFALTEYVAAPCLWIQGVPVSRRTLVKYIANKLGGAHHDSKRGATDEEIMFSILDRVSARVRILDKPVVYFELLAVGQALAASEDLRRLAA